MRSASCVVGWCGRCFEVGGGGCVLRLHLVSSAPSDRVLGAPLREGHSFCAVASLLPSQAPQASLFCIWGSASRVAALSIERAPVAAATSGNAGDRGSPPRCPLKADFSLSSRCCGSRTLCAAGQSEARGERLPGTAVGADGRRCCCCCCCSDNDVALTAPELIGAVVVKKDVSDGVAQRKEVLRRWSFMARDRWVTSGQ